LNDFREVAKIAKIAKTAKSQKRLFKQHHTARIRGNLGFACAKPRLCDFNEGDGRNIESCAESVNRGRPAAHRVAPTMFGDHPTGYFVPITRSHMYPICARPNPAGLLAENLEQRPELLTPNCFELFRCDAVLKGRSELLAVLAILAILAVFWEP